LGERISLSTVHSAKLGERISLSTLYTVGRGDIAEYTLYGWEMGFFQEEKLRKKTKN
jgi:hypothetical protein